MRRNNEQISAKALKDAFTKVKEEFDDHLEAINQNTNELRENYEYANELERKIDKLAEKMDEISFFLHELRSQKDLVVSLSPHEQKVFLVLYLEHSPLPFFEIARRAQLSDDEVENIIDSLIRKNIPVTIKKCGKSEAFVLDGKFKERQARESIVKIDENVTRSLFVKDLKNFI